MKNIKKDMMNFEYGRSGRVLTIFKVKFSRNFCTNPGPGMSELKLAKRLRFYGTASKPPVG